MPFSISTKGWESLPKLKDIKDWAHWDQTTRDFIRIAGFEAALSSDSPPEKSPTQAEHDYRELVSNWSMYQSQFVSVIIALNQGQNRIDLESPDPPLKRVTTVRQAMDRLATKVRTSGQTGPTYYKLLHRWQTISLSQFDSVEAYATEYNSIHTAMIQINKSLRINESLLVGRFVLGLGDQYRSFRENLFQNNQVLPIRLSDDTETPGISLSTAISNAQVTELQWKNDHEGKVPYAARAATNKGYKRKITWSPCSECNDPRHSDDRCFKQHPELKNQPREPRLGRYPVKQPQDRKTDSNDSSNKHRSYLSAGNADPNTSDIDEPNLAFISDAREPSSQ